MTAIEKLANFLLVLIFSWFKNAYFLPKPNLLQRVTIKYASGIPLTKLIHGKRNMVKNHKPCGEKIPAVFKLLLLTAEFSRQIDAYFNFGPSDYF